MSEEFDADDFSWPEITEPVEFDLIIISDEDGERIAYIISDEEDE